MRRWLPVLILLALTGVAARPLWSASFLASYDGPLHLMRTFALDLTLRQGSVYPRWLLDLAYGYGYPIFNYYPPLGSYLVETVHLLGWGLAEAFKITFTALIGSALFGAYTLGKELFAGEKQVEAIGLLTAAAYVFFPYFMVGLYTRGALAEVLALAILPWLFWSLRRTLIRQTAGWLALLALCLAILLLAHSLTSVIIAPVLVALVVFELLRLSPAKRMKGLLYAALAAALGAALAAFYWLPFIAELSWVRMGRGMDILADVFETNFLKPAGVIQPSWLYEYGGPPVPLGLAAMAIGGLVLLGVVPLGKRIKARGTVLFFGAAALLAAIAVTEPMRDVWLALPLSNMIQSVWRVELVVNLGVAVVIGSLPSVQSALLPGEGKQAWSRLALTGVAGLALIWAAVANLSPEEIILPRDVFDLAHLARFEVSGASPGTTTFGEYMPATMTAPDLVGFRAANAPQANAAPQVSVVEHNGTSWTIAVSAAAPVSIPLRAFYFPDSAASVDGKPARVHKTTAMDLLTVDVPAGSHQVRVFTQNTWARTTGVAISAAAALLVVGLVGASLKRRDSAAGPSIGLGLVLLGMTALPAAAALTSTPQPLQATRVGMPSGFDLVGLSVAGAQLKSGAWLIRAPQDTLHLQAYWQVHTSGLADGPIAWRLVDAAGRVWAQRAQLPRYGTALQQTWVPNEIVEDEYDLPLPGGVPAGRYALQVSPDSRQDYVTTGEIELEAGSDPATASAMRWTHPVNALFGNQIRLLGYDAPATAGAGQAYELTLYWQAERDVLEDYTESVQLLNAQGRLVAQHDSITGEGLDPTSLWIPGRQTVERRRIVLPGNLPPGSYTCIALLYRLSDLRRLPVVTPAGTAPDSVVVLGQLQVSR